MSSSSSSQRFSQAETGIGTCGQCSSVNEPESRFCGGCGQPLWEACAATSKRLQQSAADAKSFLPDHDVASLWTFGGAALMHGWLARDLVERVSTA